MVEACFRRLTAKGKQTLRLVVPQMHFAKGFKHLTFNGILEQIRLGKYDAGLALEATAPDSHPYGASVELIL